MNTRAFSYRRILSRQQEMRRRGFRLALLPDRRDWEGFREGALQLLRYAYLYVRSSPPTRVNESFGRSVVEAMALGVPTVCFRSGALQEIVVHEKTGLICEESAGDLAKGMARMLSSPEFRNLCGRQAFERFANSYSPRVTRDPWLEVFSTGSASR